MNDFRDLKAIAEACQQHQPLRFMRSHGALYIRNDNGIVFDVHQNRSFPEFVAQNKDYADLVLAANPAAVLALIAENERDELALRAFSRVAENAVAERDQLRAEVAGLRTGYQAYERVNAELKAEVGALRKNADHLQSATAFVQKLCDSAGNQPSVATGYLHDILAAMGKGEKS